MINLEVKRPAHLVPSYSLTGDLLSYLRCERQYRYYNGSSLPPSRPVQLWYGEFVHGVLEAAYRAWQQAQGGLSFPWPCTPSVWGEVTPARQSHDVGELGDRVESVLRAQGKEARSRDARAAAYRRAEAAVNLLGPHLFPLIADAETKVIGTRSIPARAENPDPRAGRYELHGVIDVVTQLSLASVSPTNPLRRAIESACPSLPPEFEVIADYKGASRPALGDDYWEQGDWQVQTYAWLRGRQAHAIPITAGVLIYINELAPGTDDFRNIQKQAKDGRTDVVPDSGSNDARIIRNWRPGQATDQLSLAFRLRRAIRVIPIDAQSIGRAVAEFDDVVLRIEENIRNEAQYGVISGGWKANCKDEATCASCDFRHFCPTPGPDNRPITVKPPPAP